MSEADPYQAEVNAYWDRQVHGAKRIAEQPTFELRWDETRPRVSASILQQKWLVTTRDAAGSHDTQPEWRDVPVVRE